jgi:putative transposase
MDGRGRVFESIFVERLWPTVEYEEVYLKHYQTVGEARLSLARYFASYDHEWPHQSLDYRTPAEVYGAEGIAWPNRYVLAPGDAAWPVPGTPVALRAPSVPAASAW